MPTYQTTKKKTTTKKRVAKPAVAQNQEPVEAPSAPAPDPYAPVPNTVRVETVHPYRLYVHTQDLVLPPRTPKTVINDAWVQEQIRQNILRIV